MRPSWIRISKNFPAADKNRREDYKERDDFMRKKKNIKIAASYQVLLYSLLFVFFLSVASGLAAAADTPDEALREAMALMNGRKFAEAKKTLKDALQKDPSNELLWVSYDSCVRSEMLAKNEASDAAVKSEGAPAGESGPEAPVYDGGQAPDPVLKSSSVAPEVSASPAIAGDKNPAGPAVQDINCSILEADFSTGAAAGDMACLLNDTFKFITADGTGSYLMAGSKDRNATVSFTFNIKKFPEKVKLIFSHRLVKKDRFLSAAPILIEVNEKKVNYDAVKLGNKLDSTEFDVTNLSKNGANIITLYVENPKFPYLLRNVKAMLYFKD
ncbi:MAG TPA: hypothetical protein DC017_04855 [Candidatus Wallbacteria bacterium]|nr:hypothetical protein [Candidatus Wallbacteria bacterium]